MGNNTDYIVNEATDLYIIVILLIFINIVSGNFLKMLSFMVPGRPFIYEIDANKTYERERMDFDWCSRMLTGDEQTAFNQIKTSNKDDLKECKNIILKSEINSPIKITRIADMKVSRSYDITIRIKNNNVLIIGGDQNNSAEIFNYDTKTFTLVSKSIDRYINHNSVPYGYEENKRPFEKPILLEHGNVFYKGAIFNTETNTFHKPKTPEEKKYLSFFIKLASGKGLEEETHFNFFTKLFSRKELKEKKYFVENIFSNGEALISDSSEICLKNPLYENKYKPAKNKFNRSITESIYMSEKCILIAFKKEPDDNKKLEYSNNWSIYNPLNGTLKDTKFKLDSKIFKLDSNNIILKEFVKEIDNNNSEFERWKTSKVNLFDDSVISFGIVPYSYGILNKKYLLSRGYAYYTVYNIETKQVYRTFISSVDRDSAGFTRLNDNEILITGGNEFSHINEIFSRTKYAGIVSIKEEGKVRIIK